MRTGADFLRRPPRIIQRSGSCIGGTFPRYPRPLQMISSFRLLVVAALLPIGHAFAGAVADAALSPNAQVLDCKPGPWGRVQWHYLHLEAPDWILDSFETPSSQPTWIFPRAGAAMLAKLFTDAGVARETVERWFADRRAVTAGPEATTLFPSEADVLGLSEQSRVAIYEELARAPQNEYHANPVRILDADVDAWLGRREIRPEIRELIKRLSYRRGQVRCFSDLAVLLGHARDESEVRDFMKLASRVRAVMAYLQIGPEDDNRTIDKYWTAGFKRKDVLPMLDSVSLLPGGGRLGFAHLLPPEARKLIYTYPTLAMAAKGRMPDCHWTALNFFSYSPQNVFLDLRLVGNQMLGGHDVVQPPYQFGDILGLMNKAGQGLHSCVYLCDELVFTKNGESASAPWIISTLADVQRYYSGLPIAEIRGFRRRWAEDR